jgi:hypothetical protein
VHTEQIVATKIKVSEEAKIKTKTMLTQRKTIVKIVKHQATLWKIAGNCKQRKQQCM